MSNPTTAQATKTIATLAVNILVPATVGYIAPGSIPNPTIAYATDTGVSYINATGVWAEFATGFATQGSSFRARTVADVTTGNVNIASGLAAGATINGVVLITGDRVLLAAQSTATQNGLYTVPATGAASFAAEWRTGAVFRGTLVEIGAEPTRFPGSTWKVFAAVTVTVGGVDPLLFPRLQTGLSAAGAVAGVYMFAVPGAASGSSVSVTDLSGAAAVGITATTAGRGTGALTISGGGASNQWVVENF